MPSPRGSMRPRRAAVEAAAARIGPAAAHDRELAHALAVSAAPARLAADLGAARSDLAVVEEAAHGGAGSGEPLIEALGRVRGIAGQRRAAARFARRGRCRRRSRTRRVGARTAAAAFADPIRHEIAGLEGAAALAGDAAQATADRIAARLLGLTATVATVERRLAEVARPAQCRRERRPVQPPLPRRHDDRRDRIADEVGQAAALAHEAVDAEDQRHARDRHDRARPTASPPA